MTPGDRLQCAAAGGQGEPDEVGRVVAVARLRCVNLAWTQIVALAANLLACFRHLALPAGELRDAALKLLRYRLWQLPARLTRGQRKQWLHLRADWPWTTDVINTWQAVKAIPAPT